MRTQQSNVKTWFLWRGINDVCFVSSEHPVLGPDNSFRPMGRVVIAPATHFEAIFGGDIKPMTVVEMRSERVVRKRGKFAKRPARKGKAK